MERNFTFLNIKLWSIIAREKSGGGNHKNKAREKIESNQQLHYAIRREFVKVHIVMRVNTVKIFRLPTVRIKKII